MGASAVIGRNLARAGVASLLLCFGVTSCGSGEGGEKERTTAKEQCGSVLSPSAAAALEQVMGTKKFSDAGRSGLTDVVKQLQSDHAERLRWSQGKKICEISPGNGASTIKVTFSLYASDDLPGDGHSASLHAYSMGKGALSGAEDAELYFECTSPELKGSAERPARILGHLSYWKAPEDTRATHDANLTVLHSISLAVAKELKCENNADLPSEPKLTPKD